MTTELKPCPFCGGTECQELTGHVYCNMCHACGPDGDGKTDGVKLWNAAPRRDDVPVAVAVEVETLHDKYTRAALTGLCMNPMWDEDDFEKLAEVARLQADAAMKARGT